MMNEDIREQQRKEAIERLHMLEKLYNLNSNVLKEFKQDGTIYYSERINKIQNGILFWLHNNLEYVKAVETIEKKYKIYVYHCILSHTELGDLLTMLYISSDMENWSQEKSDLMSGYIDTYVYDFSEFGSEFGYVQIAGINGGLTRVY